ncbi:MAG TPA: hypothetical protein VMY77_05835, partial [Chitinophagaceae bacterium]|nr:hypothetical protein [Chitinophagaceae bacterium]
MKIIYFFNRLFLFFLFSCLIINAFSQKQNTGKSDWVSFDKNGKLSYKTLPGGDRIMDFSYAGYMGGGVSIPDVKVKITLNASEGDNTDAIQAAINEVSKMPLVNGFRGEVALNAGTYNCERALNINASGVVLRGSGSDEKGTIINMTGKPHLCISARGNITTKTTGTPSTFSDAYVPSGSNSFTLADASSFIVGDTIRIIRPVTEAWVKLMGMDLLVRDGKKQTWVTGDITCDRVITKKDKNNITVDVPLTDS